MKILRTIYRKKSDNQIQDIRKFVFSFGISESTFERDLSSKRICDIPYFRTRIYLIVFGEPFAELINLNWNERYGNKITQNTFSGGGNHHNDISRVDTGSSTDVLNN